MEDFSLSVLKKRVLIKKKVYSDFRESYKICQPILWLDHENMWGKARDISKYLMGACFDGCIDLEVRGKWMGM